MKLYGFSTPRRTIQRLEREHKRQHTGQSLAILYPERPHLAEKIGRLLDIARQMKFDERPVQIKEYLMLRDEFRLLKPSVDGSCFDSWTTSRPGERQCWQLGMFIPFILT